MTEPALVVDVGTSAVKAALLDPRGDVRSQATVPLETRTAPDGVMEQDAVAWWDAVVGAVRGLESRAGARRVILTGQMQNLTLTDGAGRPLRPTLLYGDVRARDEAREVASVLGAERLVQLTANAQDAAGLLAKALWLGRHEPDAWARATRAFLGAADLLAFRLTGEAACDTTTASTTGLMAFEGREALPLESFAALGLADLPPRLPRLVPGGARVGALREGPAADLGLPAGLPVHLAPGDAGATTVGAGSGEPGIASAYVGTSGWVAFSAEGRGDPERGVFTLAHPAPGRSIRIAPLLTAGGNLSWAAAAIGADPDYDRLVEGALGRPPGRILYLPYLQGERSPFRDPTARGAFIGMDAATTRGDLVRAVLEGVALAYRHALEALVPDAAGDAPLILSGGGTRSTAWCALFATVVGRTVRVQDEPESVGLRGALRTVQVHEGEATTYGLAVRGRDFAPDAALREHYDALFATFRGAHADLARVYRGLAELKQP